MPATEPDISPAAVPSDDRRTFRLGVLNGVAFTFAESLIAADLVLTNFVSKLTSSNFLIGLVVPLRDAGWFLPQLFVSSYLQYRDQMLPIYRRMAVIRSAAWVGMALAVLTLRNPGWLLLVFYVLYSIQSLASGVSGLSFMDVVAKTVSSRRRGAFFAARMFFGGLLALAASAMVEAALGGRIVPSYMGAISLLTFVSWVFASLGLLAFSSIREPRGEIREEPSTLGQHVRRAARLPRDNRDFRWFLAGRAVLILGYMAAPFYGLYATRELGASDQIVGVFLAARTIAFLVSNPIWARVSSQRGNRLVMLISAGLGAAFALFAFVARPALEASALPQAAWGYAFVPLFALWGAYESGTGVGGAPLLLDLAPPRDRAIYIGFTNSVLGVVLLSTSLGGVMADLLGFRGVFGFALACYLIGVYVLWRMREPRTLGNGEPASG